jgi:hypothetical protein
VAVDRRTVDLSGYPDLVVVLLGLQVRRLRGLGRVYGLGPPIIEMGGDSPPDGLLFSHMFLWSLWPPQVGIRQYWRDLDSLERWTRSEPHRTWWRDFLRDTGGTGFWHESYFMGGGMEAIYDEVSPGMGMARFAPIVPARGAMFSSRRRAGRSGETPAAVIPESDLYGD